MFSVYLSNFYDGAKHINTSMFYLFFCTITQMITKLTYITLQLRQTKRLFDLSSSYRRRIYINATASNLNWPQVHTNTQLRADYMIANCDINLTSEAYSAIKLHC